MADNRQPMSPAEFDAACRELVRRCPWLSETSGRRSEDRNRRVGGHKASKHLIGMARDFHSETPQGMTQALPVAHELGLWAKLHDVNSGDHLHVQGLPRGPIVEWWLVKYGKSVGILTW